MLRVFILFAAAAPSSALLFGEQDGDKENPAEINFASHDNIHFVTPSTSLTERQLARGADLVDELTRLLFDSDDGGACSPPPPNRARCAVSSDDQQIDASQEHAPNSASSFLQNKCARRIQESTFVQTDLPSRDPFSRSSLRKLLREQQQRPRNFRSSLDFRLFSTPQEEIATTAAETPSGVFRTAAASPRVSRGGANVPFDALQICTLNPVLRADVQLAASSAVSTQYQMRFSAALPLILVWLYLLYQLRKLQRWFARHRFVWSTDN